MRSDRVLHAVNSHTEGMPTRVITGGVGTLPGATMLERKTNFERDRDDLRTLLMYEPRGHSAMSGAILQPPTRADADVGVLFIEVSGCLAMCGHGTIGVCTVLVETGMVEVTEPVTTIHLDTPAGLVRADIEVADGRAEAVTITNVPSFVVGLDLSVDVPGYGRLTFDLAYGGNFYASLPAADLGLELDPAQAPALIATGLEVMAAINAQHRPVHPEQPGIAGCRHVVLTGPPAEGADGRGATVIHPGWIDRSPCGTGTSAHLATLHARGELDLGTPFVNESLIGSRFTGQLVAEARVGDRAAVIPTIRGRAWITGTAQYLLDPSDPFPAGFLIGAASDDALACEPALGASTPGAATSTPGAATSAESPATPAPSTPLPAPPPAPRSV